MDNHQNITKAIGAIILTLIFGPSVPDILKSVGLLNPTVAGSNGAVTDQRLPPTIPPEKTVQNYCQTLNANNYQDAWDMLPEGFKQRKTGSDYGSYVEWWEGATPVACNVEDIEQFDQYEANVDTLLQYDKGGSNRIRFNLALSEAGNAWSINDIAALRALKTDDVRIRTGPGTDYEISHKGAKANRVWIYRSQKDIADYDWYKIEVDNSPYDGWVRGDMLTYP